MNRHNTAWTAALAFICLYVSARALPAREIQVPVIMHVHSTFSGNGAMTLEEIAVLARSKGIRGIIFADHDVRKIEYGVFPLQNLLKRTYEEGSVLKSGPESYLARVRELNRKYPDITLIPGVESAPFYFWSGSLFRNNLTLGNENKHMVIAGLFDPEQYRRLPVAGNERDGGRTTLPLLVWPMAVIFLGSLIVHRQKLFGTLIIIFGAALLANNFPFKALPYDAYHGDQGDRPYQQVIDYVNAVAPETGIVFWAHPESPNFARGEKIGPVSVSTPKYVNSLVATRGYTGFAYFWEGCKETGKPGGTWDMLLTEYAAGRRQDPVWACGELDYRKEGQTGDRIDAIENIIAIDEQQEVNADSILRAIKTGRFYTAYRPHASYGLVLDRFAVKTTERAAGPGEKLSTAGRPYAVLCDLRASDAGRHNVTLDVIRNGVVIETYHLVSPFSLSIPGSAKPGKSYYRLEITAENGAKIVTNPVFIE